MAVIVVGDIDRDAVVGDDQVALLVADQSVAGAAAAGLRRAGAARHPLRRRHRQGDDRDAGRLSNLRPARNQGSVGGYRADHAGPVVRRHARRPARRADPAREPAVSQSRRGSQPVPDAADEGRSAAAGAGLERRRRARSRSARDRAPARRAVRLHRDRARARQAGDDGQLRARGDGEPGPRVGEPRRRVHAQLPAGRSAADDLAGARLPPALRPGDHARGDQRARPRTGSPIRTASSSSPRPRRPASPCPIRRSSPPSSRPRPASASSRTWTPAPGRRSWTRRRRAARS